MVESLGAVLAALIAVSVAAAIVSFFMQARHGERVDPRKPWRWLLLACVGGLLLTLAAAFNSHWSIRSIGAVVPFAVLAPLALAGAIGALHRSRQVDEP